MRVWLYGYEGPARSDACRKCGAQIPAGPVTLWGRHRIALNFATQRIYVALLASSMAYASLWPRSSLEELRTVGRSNGPGRMSRECFGR